MYLLHHFTAVVAPSFATGSAPIAGRSIYSIEAVRLAFQHDYLLNAIFAVSSLHITLEVIKHRSTSLNPSSNLRAAYEDTRKSAYFIPPTAATAVGLGMVCNILFFPQSTSHLVLETMMDVVAPMKGFLSACKLSFRDPHAQFDAAQLQKTKSGVIAAYKGMEATLGFLALDLFTGRWSTEDIQSLHEPLRQLVIMFMGLLQLQIVHVESKARNEKLDLLDEVMHGGNNGTEKPEIGQNHLVQVLSLRNRVRHAETEDLLEKSMGALFTSSGPLLETCCDVVDAITEAVQTVNNRRWFKKPSLDECIELRLKHENVPKRLKEIKISSKHCFRPIYSIRMFICSMNMGT